MIKITDLLNKNSVLPELKTIAEKIINNERITENDGLELFQKSSLGFAASLANYIREKKHNHKTFFNKNIHIEPTNICIYNCIFCSYSRKFNQPDAWENSIQDIINSVKKYDDKAITEVHIVGGTHPNKTIEYYCEMLTAIKSVRPNLHIKAFTAVELEYMIKKAGLSIKEGLQKLKNAGLNSIPGGGAEIFDEALRKQICPDKTSSEKWLEIHEIAHQLGIPSNATMLYGHIETYHHRIDHLSRLRKLQDKTQGFNTFIPLKYRHANNALSHIGEVSIIEVMKNYAISRIFLDNIPHVKAYWPSIGKSAAQLSLSFGVDDIDGTIDDSTKIYSMAGAEDKSPIMTTGEMITLIKNANRIPVERDTLFNEIAKW